MRQQPTRGREASILHVLSPLLAAAALILFPMTARAGTSSETVYHLPIPSVQSEPSEGTPRPQSATNRPHPAPEASTEAQGPTPSSDERQPEGEVEPHPKEHPKPAVVLPGEGRPPSNPSAHPRTVGTGPAQIQTSESSGGDGGGGTSPAVPIVIVVLVLGALSIGVVFYRERRQAGRPAD